MRTAMLTVLVFALVTTARAGSGNNSISMDRPTNLTEWDSGTAIDADGGVSYNWIADPAPYYVKLKVVDWNGATLQDAQVTTFYASGGSGTWAGTCYAPSGSPDNPVPGQKYYFTVTATSYDFYWNSLASDTVYLYQTFS